MANWRARRTIALLRAVNVGGRCALRMADLRSALAGLGYLDPQTVLQSGNAVFGVTGGGARATAALIESAIERELSARFSLQSDVCVRSDEEWAAIVAANPFPDEAASDPSHLVVMVLKTPAARASVRALQQSIQGRERVQGTGRELYLVYPDGIGTSKVTGAAIERTLGTRGTARNWNTVQKLAVLAGGA